MKHVEDFESFKEQNEFQLDPQTAVTHLDLHMIKASKGEFQGVINKVWFFSHPTQCLWWKIQMNRLAT